MKDIPIIFFQAGDASYLPYTFWQARQASKNSPIYLLGDKSNCHYPNIEHFEWKEYTSKLKTFEKCYEHISSNPKNFEFFCFIRWLTIQEFTERKKLNEFLYLDSDVLLYSIPKRNDVNSKKWKLGITYLGVPGKTKLSASPSSIWIRDFCILRAFNKSVLNFYKNNLAVQKMKNLHAERIKNKQGGLCDMWFWAQIITKNRNLVKNLWTPNNKKTFDININESNCFEEEKMKKKIFFKKNRPYCKNKKTKKMTQMASLHFVGRSKREIPNFTTNKNLKFFLEYFSIKIKKFFSGKNQKTNFLFFKKQKKTLDNIVGKKILKKENGNRAICKLFYQNKPFFVSRFGTTELSVVCWNLFKNKQTQKNFPKDLKKNISVLSGFYPSDNTNMKKFAEMFVSKLNQIDILGVRWESFDQCFWENEAKILKEHCVHTKLCGIEVVGLPFLFKNSWIKKLQNRKVLIIHPFKESIKKQFLRKKLWNKHIGLPKLRPIFLKAEQSLANEKTKSPYRSWFEALDSMCKKIEKIDFEIALIGAGAYGLFLGAHCKKIGKSAIHVGGALQLFFGIKGKRWTEKTSPDHIPKKVWKSGWVWPLPSEVPQGAQSVENACYWK